MRRLLRHRLPRLTSRGLSNGSSSRVFIKFPHCFLCLFGQFGLALCPFIRIVLTALEAGGISDFPRCQWRSWAWRIECEFLHVFGSNISILPPLSCPSPLYPLYAHLALILVLLAMFGFIRSAIFLIDVIWDVKGSVCFWSLSSLLRSFFIIHFLQSRIWNNRIL